MLESQDLDLSNKIVSSARQNCTTVRSVPMYIEQKRDVQT